MSKEDTESAIRAEDQCVTCRVRIFSISQKKFGLNFVKSVQASRAVMMVYPCNHVALCRLCFVKMIKHVSENPRALCFLCYRNCLFYWVRGITRSYFSHNNTFIADQFFLPAPKIYICRLELYSFRILLGEGGHHNTTKLKSRQSHV